MVQHVLQASNVGTCALLALFKTIKPILRFTALSRAVESIGTNVCDGKKQLNFKLLRHVWARR
jgi:hypothetical protein